VITLSGLWLILRILCRGSKNKIFQLSFEDIETAFYFGHPAETEYRLHELQVRCYLQMGKTLEAQVRVNFINVIWGAFELIDLC
jgi:hypothetical protein